MLTGNIRGPPVHARRHILDGKTTLNRGWRRRPLLQLQLQRFAVEVEAVLLVVPTYVCSRGLTVSASRTTFSMSTSCCLTVWCLKTVKVETPNTSTQLLRVVKWLLKRLLGQLSDVGTREDDMTVSWFGKSPAQDAGWHDGHAIQTVLFYSKWNSSQPEVTLNGGTGAPWVLCCVHTGWR